MANTWISEMENDIEELKITHENITECTLLRNKLHNFKGFQEKPKRKPGTLWTEEKREKNEERVRYGGKGKKKEGRS